MMLYMVELAVSDWPHSRLWYDLHLGWSIEHCDDARQFVLYSTCQGRLALKAGIPKPSSVILHVEVENLRKLIEQFQAYGVDISNNSIKASHEGYERILVRDPDGYQICFFHWTTPKSQ